MRTSCRRIADANRRGVGDSLIRDLRVDRNSNIALGCAIFQLLRASLIMSDEVVCAGEVVLFEQLELYWSLINDGGIGGDAQCEEKERGK